MVNFWANFRNNWATFSFHHPVTLHVGTDRLKTHPPSCSHRLTLVHFSRENACVSRYYQRPDLTTVDTRQIKCWCSCLKWVNLVVRQLVWRSIKPYLRQLVILPIDEPTFCVLLWLLQIQTQGRRMEGAGQIPLSHVWLHLTKLGRLVFFCKTIYSFHKTGHKTIQKTNHYILS